MLMFPLNGPPVLLRGTDVMSMRMAGALKCHLPVIFSPLAMVEVISAENGWGIWYAERGNTAKTSRIQTVNLRVRLGFMNLSPYECGIRICLIPSKTGELSKVYLCNPGWIKSVFHR